MRLPSHLSKAENPGVWVQGFHSFVHSSFNIAVGLFTKKQGLEGYVNPKGRQACKQASSCRDPVTRPETPKVLHAISKAWVE